MRQVWRRWLCAASCSGTVALALLMAGCGGGNQQAAGIQVTIKSAPADGAEVMAGGEQLGLTPVTATLQPGFVDVLLKKEGFKLSSDRIEVKSGAPMEFTIDMRPLVGFITIETEPLGAKVLMDGSIDLGATPIYSRETPVGEHSFDISMENYYPASDKFAVEEDFQYTKKYILKAMESTLSLTSRPSGATIFVNNERQAETTPTNFTLLPGPYVISVYAEGFVQTEEKIDLKPNEKRQLALTMVQGDAPPGMVLVPAGEFIFGASDRAPDEAPQTKLDIPAFYIDKTEVTNAQYKLALPDHKFPVGQEEFPVGGVSWNDAMRYASLVGKRLPTEREWEKAARGAEGLEYSWGKEYDPNLCNGLDQNKEASIKVSQYIGGMSPYGCMDMSGNVFEWTQDWYEAYPGNTQVTKEYGQVFRVLRGGSYLSDRFDVRAARRRFDKMDTKKPDYGFRCARDVAVK